MIHVHRISASDGVELALHRLEASPGEAAGAGPLLLVAGTFNARTFWLGVEGKGIAARLAAEGFDTWIMEPRGHGSSSRPPSWLLSDWIERDAPAAVQAVAQMTGSMVTWVGHSAGGVVGAAFAGLDDPASRMLRRLVLLGAPGPGLVEGRRRLLARLLYCASIARARGTVPGEPLKLGPEPESARLVRQWLGWNLRGTWRSPAGLDYLAQLARVRVPVLAVAGTGDDLLAPPDAVRDLLERFSGAQRTLLLAGREQGMSRDYTHGGMVLARTAGEEIWPRIIRWLSEGAATHPSTGIR